MALKTSTALVKSSYIECMIYCFNENTISQALVFVPNLLSAVEKALAQPTQVPSVTEGLSAAVLLLKIAASSNEKENNLQNFWNIILDMEKQIFISEKFISLASDNGKHHHLIICFFS